MPDKRFKVSHAHSVTLTDKVTGISHTVEDKDDSRKEWDMRQQCKYELSRIVQEFEARRMAGEVKGNKNDLVAHSMSLVPMSYYENVRAEVAMIKSLYADPEFTLAEIVDVYSRSTYYELYEK